MPAPHALFVDKWNPYATRDRRTMLLDDATFKQLLDDRDGYVNPGLFMTGCLDAPDDIPLGGARCIRTIGGFEREDYWKVQRDLAELSLLQRQIAEAEVGDMLGQILSEVDSV